MGEEEVAARPESGVNTHLQSSLRVAVGGQRLACEQAVDLRAPLLAYATLLDAGRAGSDPGPLVDGYGIDPQTTQLVRDAYQFIEYVQVGRRDDFEVGYSETFTRSFELLLPPGYPEGEQVFRGRDGLKRWIGGIREIWDEWRMEPERFLPAGDRVVVLIHILARGHLSVVELDREHVGFRCTARGEGKKIVADLLRSCTTVR